MDYFKYIFRAHGGIRIRRPTYFIMSDDICSRLDGLAVISAQCACCAARLHPSASYPGFNFCRFRRYACKMQNHVPLINIRVFIFAFTSVVGAQHALGVARGRCPGWGVEGHGRA